MINGKGSFLRYVFFKAFANFFLFLLVLILARISIRASNLLFKYTKRTFTKFLRQLAFLN